MTSSGFGQKADRASVSLSLEGVRSLCLDVLGIELDL